MNSLQAWLIVGVPAIFVIASLLVGRSATRAMFAYLMLAGGVIFFLAVPADRVSAAAFGLLTFMLVATGRGTEQDDAPEHHDNRRRYTTTPSAN
ncbi:MAG: hypothetical protein ACI867_002320 [Glaciecola sp.]|jgi:hypothetical protein